MQAVLTDNPFPKAAPNRTVAVFLDDPPPADTLAAVKGRKDEQIGLGTREIYIHYGDGMGQSKLVVPAAKAGTARNMNTVATLAKMAADLSGRPAAISVQRKLQHMRVVAHQERMQQLRIIGADRRAHARPLRQLRPPRAHLRRFREDRRDRSIRSNTSK